MHLYRSKCLCPHTKRTSKLWRCRCLKTRFCRQPPPLAPQEPPSDLVERYLCHELTRSFIFFSFACSAIGLACAYNDYIADDAMRWRDEELAAELAAAAAAAAAKAEERLRRQLAYAACAVVVVFVCVIAAPRLLCNSIPHPRRFAALLCGARAWCVACVVCVWCVCVVPHVQSESRSVPRRAVAQEEAVCRVWRVTRRATGACECMTASTVVH